MPKLKPETRALRFAAQVEAAGHKVSRIIVESDRIEVVLQGEESKDATPYEVWQRARKAQGR